MLTHFELQVKEMLKREVEKGDVESQRNGAIIADYKKICSQLSERLDKEQAANVKTINMYKVRVPFTRFNRLSSVRRGGHVRWYIYGVCC